MRETELRNQKYINCFGFIVAIILSLGAVLFFLRIWEMDFNVPLGFSGDVVLSEMIIKSISQNGLKGLYINESLGAPEFAAFIDTPFFDPDMGIEIWLLSKLPLSPTMIFYLVYIISYPLSAIFMYLLLSRITHNILLRTILSVSFSVNPYHFFRFGHITLSQYQVIPVAVLIALIVAEEPFSTIRPTKYKGNKCKSIFLYVGCVWIGLGNIYYAFFALICISIGVLCKVLKKKKRSVIYEDAVPLYVLFVSIIISIMPKVLYSFKYGKNTVAGIRFPFETELYGLKLIQLLLPPAYSRIPFLAKITNSYNNSAVNINENITASLGLMAGIGFVIVCFFVVLSFLPLKKRDTLINERLNFLSLCTLALIIYCTVGGVGTIVSYAITPELRGLNRVSIFIACLCLCSVAVFMEYMISSKRHRFNRSFDAFIIPCFIILFAVSLYIELGYQSAGWQDIPHRKDGEYREFFSSVESSLNNGASVYELPFVRFPEEAPVFEMDDYTQGVPYIYTDTIRWSYGAMKGRNTVAESLYLDGGSSIRFIEAILSNGFGGVYINTDGFQDKGAEIIHFYSDRLGLTPLISNDGKLLFYNIEGLCIDDYKLSSSYQFIIHYANSACHQLNAGDVQAISSSLYESLPDMADILWEWALSYEKLKGKMSDEDYVSWLYESLLIREESNEELENWCNILSSGISRYEVFHSFIFSEEFSNKYIQQ